jgi:Rrf2 family protein
MAKHSEECTSAREIAGLYGIPLPLLMNILKQMAQQGLAQSVRGPRGGYRLAIPPEKISLNDIIKAVEGPVQLVQCVDWYQNKLRGKTKTGCELMAACPVRPTIHLVHARLVEFLSGVTLAEVVRNDSRGRDQHNQDEQQDIIEPGLPACSSAVGDRSFEAAHLPG